MPKCKKSFCGEEADPRARKRYCAEHWYGYQKKRREHKERQARLPQCERCCHKVSPSAVERGEVLCNDCAQEAFEAAQAQQVVDELGNCNDVEELKVWLSTHVLPLVPEP